MTDTAHVTPDTNAQRHPRSFIRWMALVPLVLFTLLIVGQLALNFRSPMLPADVSSILVANYYPWDYSRIAKINATAMMKDLLREQQQNESGGALPVSTLQPGSFFLSPTPVSSSTVTPPPTAVPATPTETEIPPTETERPTRTASFTATATQTSTATLRPILPTFTDTTEPEPPSDTPVPTSGPSLTPQPTVTHTNTLAPATETLAPTPTFTITTAPTNTQPPALTSTQTTTPTATFTATHTLVPTATLPYARLHPIVENEGISEKAGENRCRAYFGYKNDNPYTVNIPTGELNQIRESYLSISPGLPQDFGVGRVIAAFTVEWEGGGSITWLLDGREATAAWCNPDS